MKNPEMINWYFPQLLNTYEGEKIYFDKLWYDLIIKSLMMRL